MAEKKLIECTATKEIEGEKVTATVHLDLGENCDEMTEQFGGEFVYNNAVANVKIRAQSYIRSLMKAGKSQEEVTAAFVDWRPDVKRTVTKDPKAAARRNFAALSDEEKEAMIAEFQASLG